MSRMHEEIDGTRRRSLTAAALSVISAAELEPIRSGSVQPKRPSPQGVKPEAYFPGFIAESVGTSGTTIHVLRKGARRPLLLLHGYPETHLTWHKVAPRLAEQFSVVVPDLRRYGESGKPQDGERHQNYSFRAMAQDQVEVMRHYGHERFVVAAHNRGTNLYFSNIQCATDRTSLDTSVQMGLLLGCSSCHLSAEVFFLLNFFVVEGR